MMPPPRALRPRPVTPPRSAVGRTSRSGPGTVSYIVASPRPRVGKTLVARLVAEFALIGREAVAAFDINMSEPSLVDYLPRLTETGDITTTAGQIAVMDRLVTADGVPKIVDLGYPFFDSFFRVADEVGFMKEAVARGVAPVILFVADRDRASQAAFVSLRERTAPATLIVVDNENVLYDDVPAIYADAWRLRIPILPAFLRTIIDRVSFSFTDYLRGPNDPSAELHQWIRGNYQRLRALEQDLPLYSLHATLRKRAKGLDRLSD